MVFDRVVFCRLNYFLSTWTIFQRQISIIVDLNFNALKLFCFAFTPRLYKLCLPHLPINNVPLVYLDSRKYIGVKFSRNHKDDDDMLRQMRTLYARSNRIIRIFHNCSTKVLTEQGRSFCGSFYCSCLWSQYNKSSFSKIRVAYNNLYRRILHSPLAVVPVKCL